MLLLLLSLARAEETCTVAHVDAYAVTCEEFRKKAVRQIPGNGIALSSEERVGVLETLVEEKLLLGEAYREGLDKDPEAKDDMVNTLLKRSVYSGVNNSDFSDAAMEAYYNQNLSYFIVPEKVQILRVLVRVDGRTEAEARAQAEAARERIVKGEAFKDVALAVSEDPWKARGGDVGFVSEEGKPGLPPEIVKLAFGIPVFEVSPVTRTSDGFNVIQVKAHREKIERTFTEMKGSVLRRMKNVEYQRLYDAYVAGLRPKATITVDSAALATVDLAPVGGPVPGIDP